MSENKVTAKTTATPYRTELTDGKHAWHADEPLSSGGQDTAPTPAQLLSSALAACTAITIRMYAARKKWPLTGVTVSVSRNPRGPAADGSTELAREITLEGTLDAEQRERLLEIANKCPTHKVLSGAIRIPTTLV